LILHISEVTMGNVVVTVALRQIVFRKLEQNGDQRQELLYNVLGDFPLELFDFCSVLYYQVRMISLQLGNVLEHVILRSVWSVCITCEQIQENVPSGQQKLACKA
jgi:hypothetical protein